MRPLASSRAQTDVRFWSVIHICVQVCSVWCLCCGMLTTHKTIVVSIEHLAGSLNRSMDGSIHPSIRRSSERSLARSIDRLHKQSNAHIAIDRMYLRLLRLLHAPVCNCNYLKLFSASSTFTTAKLESNAPVRLFVAANQRDATTKTTTAGKRSLARRSIII